MHSLEMPCVLIILCIYTRRVQIAQIFLVFLYGRQHHKAGKIGIFFYLSILLNAEYQNSTAIIFVL